MLFANKPADALPDSYLRYLAAGLRETFDLDGVPIRFHVRHGENPYVQRLTVPDDLAAAGAFRLQQLDQRAGGPSGSGHRARALAGIGLRAQAGRHRPGIEQVDAEPGQPQLGGVGQDQRLERGLARGVAAPIGPPGPAAAVGDEHRPAGRRRRSSGSRLRIRRWLATQVHREHPLAAARARGGSPA